MKPRVVGENQVIGPSIGQRRDGAEVMLVTQAGGDEQNPDQQAQTQSPTPEPWRDWGSDENIRGELPSQERRDNRPHG
ncbi:hypothetical protein ACNO8X_27190 [Mycobacterium sp. PDNC021]|uniref:hypothetical protein n=1 Tax=Mycobacterium sp. PDNC021 TaxID=3391399 RepID=UPI003AB0545D